MKLLVNVFAAVAMMATAASATGAELPDLNGRVVKAVTENAYRALNFADPMTG